MKEKLREIIFGTETPAGKAFDVVLLWAIIISVAAVILESVSSIKAHYGGVLKGVEWTVTILFTVEYILRLVCVQRPKVYAKSFYGIVDLLAIAPTYLGLIFAGAHSFIVIKALRLLRIFRILKMARFIREAEYLLSAMKTSRHKIAVFLGAVLTVVLIVATLMYLIEGEANGFNSIPQSMYWAIVTMTTVGYGDIAPQTILGKVLSCFLMLIGYAIIAVPTGIMAVETVKEASKSCSGVICPGCGRADHANSAQFCCMCGAQLKA